MKKHLAFKMLAVAAIILMVSACVQTAQTAGRDASKNVFTYADTIAWDGEYDVVVIGFGGAGSVAAQYAAAEGANVLIAEKAPEGHEGGNSRVCGQFFMSTDDYDSLLKHYKIKGGETTTVSETMLETYVKGMANIYDQLVNDFGAVRENIFKWRSTGIQMYMSEYPEFEGADAVNISSLSRTDVGNSALYKLLSSKAKSYSNVDVWFESPAVKLIQEPETKTIIGVVVERNGEKLNIRAINGVVMSLGGFENNREMIENFLGLTDYVFSGSPYNTGDGITMATEVGAKLWHMEVYEGSMGPFGNVAFEGVHGWTVSNAFATGSLIYVGENGQRFLREDESARHGHVSLGGVWVTPKRPEHAYLVFDQAKYEELMALDTLYARGTVSPAIIDEKAVVGNTIEELCSKTGIDYAGLSREISLYNNFAKTGEDLKLGRAARNMAAFSGKGPYYAIRVVPNILNTQGGPERNERTEILDINNKPIPHLYSAGEFGGITSNMYTAGGNMAETIIFGKIAGQNAAKNKKPLPEYVQRKKVESKLVYVPGYESDINQDVVYETGENQYIGIGDGMGGDLVIRATIEGGKITAFEILKNNETPGIGSMAIEAMPTQFIGAGSEADINAVDGVTGATVTSKALRAAAIEALSKQ